MPADDPQPRPFGEWLGEQRRGQAGIEMTDKLAELVKAVATHNKGGTLTLRIKVTPAKGDMSTVYVSDEITLKAPEAVRSESIFFIDGDDYSLRREDPTQLAFRVERASAHPSGDDNDA